MAMLEKRLEILDLRLSPTTGVAQVSGNRSLSPMRQTALVKTSLTPTSSFGGGASMGGFNCSIPGIITDNIDVRGGDCSTTASPRHMGIQQPSNNSSLSLLPSSALSSPFASPASSEGAQGGQLATHFIPGMSGGYLPSSGRERELSLSLMKDDVAAYFSADTLEARELMTSRNNIIPNPNLLNYANLSGMRYGVRGALPSLMMLSQQHPFLQEARASNQNTPIGSPQRHGGTG